MVENLFHLEVMKTLLQKVVLADITPYGGGTIYSRYATELRYPISMNQTAKIFALTFAEAGNTWNNFFII